MFGRNAKNEVDSLVGASTKIEGDLRFSGAVRIDGEVHGNVVADSADSVLIVSEHARVSGRVYCSTMIVNGCIEGPVICSDVLELQPKARIIGDVQYKTLEMHGGATVTGKLAHQEPGEPVFLMPVAEPSMAVPAGA